MSDHGYELPRLYPAEWESGRRGQTLSLFESHVYGHTPPDGCIADVEVDARNPNALGGLARRVEATVTVAGPRGIRKIALLVYVPAPASATNPAPAFLGLNFMGNHATTAEPDIRVPALGAQTERGAQSRRWPYGQILARGYAVATAYYEEIEVDTPGHARDGVRGIFADDSADPQSWGAIGGWAWGLSRMLDAVGTFSDIDSSAVFAVGHSRLGKTALWAAAQDPRFAGVISNNSGCGGASLFRHKGIEDIAVITAARPHWFAPGFAEYRGAEEQLPVDQHQLLALQAPRATHVASATRDAGADPYGEYLATLHASPIFERYGRTGPLPTGTIGPGAELGPAHALALPRPTPGRRLGAHLSYHLRDGEHDVLAEDWAHFLDFADCNSAR